MNTYTINRTPLKVVCVKQNDKCNQIRTHYLNAKKKRTQLLRTNVNKLKDIAKSDFEYLTNQFQELRQNKDSEKNLTDTEILDQVIFTFEKINDSFFEED